MKKLIVAVAVFGLCISLAQAQAASLSLRPMFGYGIGTGKQVSGTDYVRSATATTKDENMYYSGGGGIKFGIGLDAEIAEHVALGFDVGYSMGLTSEVEKSTYPTETELIEAKASYLPISLTLKVKSKLEKMTIYAGMGPSLLMMPKALITISGTDGTDVFAGEGDLTFKMGLGYHGLVGMEYALTEKVNFIAQLRSDQVSVKTDKFELTKATENGTDVLALMDIRDKNITFLEDDTTDDDTKDTLPMVENAEMWSADGLTFSIGIGYSF